MIKERRAVKRPLAVAGMCFTAVTAAAYYFSLAVSAALCAFAAAVFVFVRFSRQNRKAGNTAAALLAAIFSFTAFAVSASDIYLRDASLKKIRGAEVIYTVRVTEVTDRENGCRVIGDILYASEERIRGISALFYMNDLRPETGGEVVCRLSFYPGGYETGGSLRFNSSVIEIISVTEGKYRFAGFFGRMKNSLNNVFYTTMPDDEAAVASAMVTGERAGMTYALSSMLQRAGISHIVVVSGMHITILFGGVNLLFRRVKRLLPKAAVCVLFITALLFFYGFTPSVIRACVMGSFVFFAGMFYLPSDGLTSLSSAAVAVLLFTPSAVKNVSFQLSFACCLAIVGVYGPLRKRIKFLKTDDKTGRLKKLLKSAIEAALLSSVVNLITLPVLILNGMPVSLVSPFTNPIVLPLVPFAMTLSIVTAAAGHIYMPAALLAGRAAALFIKVILTVSSFFASFRFASIDTNINYLKEWAVFAAAAAILFLLAGRKGRIWRWILTAAITLPLAAVITLNYAVRRDAPQILFYRGEAIILKDSGRTAVILGGVSENELDSLGSYLLTMGIARPDSVSLLRNGRLDTETVSLAFPGSDSLDHSGRYAPEPFAVGRMTVKIEAPRVIINVMGFRVAVSYGDNTDDADMLLMWRGATEMAYGFGGSIVYYKDLATPYIYKGIPYGYRDVVEILVKNEGFRVNIR